MSDSDSISWLSSKDVMSKTKIKACDLMHYREGGKINFIKKGNAYFYNNEDVEKIVKK